MYFLILAETKFFLSDLCEKGDYLVLYLEKVLYEKPLKQQNMVSLCKEKENSFRNKNSSCSLELSPNGVFIVKVNVFKVVLFQDKRKIDVVIN